MDAGLRDLERRFETDPTLADALLAAAERAGDRACVRRTLERCREEVVLAFVGVKRDLEHAPIVDRFESDVARARYAEWWPPLARIVGRSAAMKALRAFVAERAGAAVSFTGEDGVGRSLAAEVVRILGGVMSGEGARFRIASLRERREDLPALITELLRRRDVVAAEAVPSWLVESFEGQEWPGNVRQLEAVVHRAQYLAAMLGVDVFDRWAWEYGVSP